MPAARELAETELVRVGDAVVSEERFRQERARRGSGESEAALLERLIRRELLFAEATRVGLEQSPALRDAWKNLVVQHLQEQLETRWESAVTVSDAEVEAEYRAHPDRYSTPPRVRVALIQLASDVPMARVEEVRRQAVEARDREPDFGALAAVSLHPSGRRNRGDLGWLTPGQAALAFPREVAAAVFELDEPGAISPALSTDEGVFLFKRIDRQPAQLRPFETVQDQIRANLRRRRLQEAEQLQYAELRARHPVQTNARRLAELAVEPSQPHLVVRPPRLPGN